MEVSLVPRHQRTSRFTAFPFGACYYPEHWDRTWIEADAKLMAEAGVNTVRMAEFAWTLMEPKREQFDFSLFQDAISTLKQHGIQTILCTPTATPPRWLTVDHPDWMRVDSKGVAFAHGTRQHCCTNNEAFRAESRRITRAMATAFQREESVVGWQTDNEFHCHIDTCYCASCQRGFRAWLVEQYAGDIAKLNTAWGTSFWSQQYDCFEHIDIPKEGAQPAPHNPSALLDFKRFLSDSIRAFQKEQVAILREVNPAWWVTHNGFFRHIDYYKFTEDLDFLSVDVYPAFWGTQPEDFIGASVLNERCRQASGTYLVPEQSSGPGGQFPFLQPTPEKGRMRLWAYQSIAHGADGMLHFRWRTCRFGAEIHWHGILDHDNVPRRRYEEFAQEGRELKAIGNRILGTSVRVDIGIAYDYEQDESQAVIAMGRLSPGRQRELMLGTLMRSKIAAGFVNEADSYAGLKVLILPSAIMMDAALAKKLEDFVAGGGILLATATTAQRDRNNIATATTPLGLLRKLFGISVEEFGKTEHRKMALAFGDQALDSNYYELVRCESAEALGHWQFAENHEVEAAHGEVGLSYHRFGEGHAYYLGTYITESNVAAIMELICQAAQVTPLAKSAENVCVIERRNAERRLTFVLNHYPHEQDVHALPAGQDLLTEQPCNGALTIAPFGVAIIES